MDRMGDAEVAIDVDVIKEKLITLILRCVLSDFTFIS